MASEPLASPTSPVAVTAPTSPAPVSSGPTSPALASPGPASPAPVSSDATTTPATAAKAQPPPGFRFMKVRKPDGTIMTVKKKLTPEEIASAAAAPLSPAMPEYELITVRKPDGTLAKVRRPIKKDVMSPLASPTSVGSKTASTPASPVTATAPKRASIASTAEAKPKVAAASVKSPTSAKAPTSPTSHKSPTSTKSVEPVVAEAAVPAVEGMSQEEALRTQEAYFRDTRRSRFKSALFQGMLRTASSSVIPELGEHDEIVSDDDMSMDGDSDDGNQGDNDDNDHGHSDNGHDDHDHDRNGDDIGTHHSNIGSNLATAAATNVVSSAAQQGLAPPQKPPAYGTPAAATTTDTKEKTSYKITTKDLEHLDEETAAKAEDRPLYRHWANISFYALASLSVVLPLLFLIFTIVLAAMDGKLVASHWHRVHQAIPVAVSAWPIIFAAVVAQSFKTWATFRVERGIRLMQLEQLVGSNSFGSAMKQPFVLRRLDFLTLMIFVVWCLSPIGTQALQRVSNVQLGDANDSSTIYYGNIMGNTNLFSETRWSLDPDVRANLLQMTAVSYIANFMPYGQGQAKNPLEDQYNHPLLSRTLGSLTQMQVGFYGLPVVLPNSTVWQQLPANADNAGSTGTGNSQYKDKATESSYEYFNFNTTSSAWNFTCGEWATTKRSNLTNMSFSLSETLAMKFSTVQSKVSNGKSGVNHIKFASLLRDSVDGSNATSNENDWEYEVIECDFVQLFYNSQVSCYVDTVSTFVADCESYYDGDLIPDSQVKEAWRTRLIDFSDELVTFGVPFAYSNGNTSTPIESITENQALMSNDYYTPTSSYLSANGGTNFSIGLGFAFNTWVGIGYCPECLFVSQINDTNFDPTFYTKVDDADHWYSTQERYAVNKIWLAVLFVCSGLLVALGCGSIIVESRIVAPDVLGYVSSTVRNSKYLHLPKTTTGTMSGGERARQNGMVKVMMQDVKANADVGKIALGLSHDKAARLKPGRVYR